MLIFYGSFCFTLDGVFHGLVKLVDGFEQLLLGLMQHNQNALGICCKFMFANL